jgi:hypothetical protein
METATSISGIIIEICNKLTEPSDWLNFMLVCKKFYINAKPIYWNTPYKVQIYNLKMIEVPHEEYPIVDRIFFSKTILKKFIHIFFIRVNFGFEFFEDFEYEDQIKIIVKKWTHKDAKLTRNKLIKSIRHFNHIIDNYNINTITDHVFETHLALSFPFTESFFHLEGKCKSTYAENYVSNNQDIIKSVLKSNYTFIINILLNLLYELDYAIIHNIKMGIIYINCILEEPKIYKNNKDKILTIIKTITEQLKNTNFGDYKLRTFGDNKYLITYNPIEEINLIREIELYKDLSSLRL